jgi:hypothetical protein
MKQKLVGSRRGYRSVSGAGMKLPALGSPAVPIWQTSLRVGAGLATPRHGTFRERA